MLGAAALFSGGAYAQEASEAPTARGEPVSSEDIVVPGHISYRDRTDDTAPVLTYGTDYFQRFEPSTVGDALKRVPSVQFLSDVLESDGVRLRGLDPAYTQILINGEQVPGAGDGSGTDFNGADQSFFVDRIPAELIERVEIVRSQSANRSGDAVAGAINIVLRDGYSLEGGYVRSGLQYYANDGAWRENLGGVWGGAVGEGNLLLGLNMQDRHNPKDKLSTRYYAPDGGTNWDGDPAGVIKDAETQTDVRDGTDYSGNFAYETPLAGGEFKLDGLIVYTDRYQDEDSIEIDDGDPTDLKSINSNNVDIEQTSWSLSGSYEWEMLGGETRIKLGYSSFETDEDEFENEVSYDGDILSAEEIERELTHLLVQDHEFSVKVRHQRDLGPVELEFGVHYQSKEREIGIGNEDDDDDFAPSPDYPNANGDLGLNVVINPNDWDYGRIERERIDPYVMISGDNGPFEWEAGLRYETTDISSTDEDGDVSDNDYQFLLPSAHMVWNVSDEDRFLFSVSRTVRNPSFSLLTPLNFDDVEDNELFGNPNLKPETAWGVDIGFEHRIGRTGVVGVNLFYRDLSDVIEMYNTGDFTEDYINDPSDFDTPVYNYGFRNTGDGEVYGIEFDLSAPLTFIGMENTGVFFNYSWLDSNIEDEFGDRRFNDQSDYVLNVGFIHDIPTWDAAFGVTYRKQGDAYSRIVSEEVTTSYDGDLEMFVERSFGERFTLRFTGSNLLDASKDETFNKFLSADHQEARLFDEYELETESAGPVFQIIGRLAF